MNALSRLGIWIALFAAASTLVACTEELEREVVEAPPVHASPPPPGPEKPPSGGAPATFAIRKLYVGDTDRDGTLDEANGWKQYGYDLDGKISTATSLDLCKRRNNAAAKNVYLDGNQGIDNGFGKNVVAVFMGIDPHGPASVNKALASGGSTILVQIAGLGPDASYNPLLARLYEGAPLGQSPLFDGADLWPVRPESLVDPVDVSTATVQAPESYLVGDTWVGRGHGSVAVTLRWSEGILLRLPIHDPWISMELDAPRQNATNGTIAGVIAIDDLVAAIGESFAYYVPACDKPEALSSIRAQVEQAADILVDGSQDPARECDGVSVGLGFEAARVELGAVGDPVPVVPTCL